MASHEIAHQQTQDFGEFSAGFDGGGDLNPSIKRLHELWSGMNHTIVLATGNPLKTALYARAFTSTTSDQYKAVMGLNDIKNFNSWIQGINKLTTDDIAEIPEPHDTAAANALEKLYGYTLQMFANYQKQGGKVPGLILSVDDDFEICVDVPNDRQPKGAIKNIGTQRTDSRRDIAQYHSETVQKYGKRQDLTRLGLGHDQLALPISFEYNLAAGVLPTKLIDVATLPVSWLFINVYNAALKVPGFLLPIGGNPHWYNETSPVIWIPDVPGIEGRTMGMLVKEFQDKQSIAGIGLVLGENFTRVQELAQQNSKNWKLVGDYNPSQNKLFPV